MKKIVAIMLTTAALGAAGCGTTEKTWTADEPPPLAKHDPSTTTVDPVRLPAGGARVSVDDINDDNVHDSVRRLTAEMNSDGRALSKAGR